MFFSMYEEVKGPDLQANSAGVQANCSMGASKLIVSASKPIGSASKFQIRRDSNKTMP